MPDSKDTSSEASEPSAQPIIPSPSGLTALAGDEEPPEQVPESNEAIRAAGERARSTITRMYEMLDQARDPERD